MKCKRKEVISSISFTWVSASFSILGMRVLVVTLTELLISERAGVPY